MPTTFFTRLAATIVLFSSLTSAVFAFSDVPANSQFFAATDWMEQQRFLHGYPDGTYRPQGLVNRAEYLTTLLRMLGVAEQYAGDTHCFSDFTGQEQWFWKNACLAKQMGILAGYSDGSFRATQTVTDAEAVKMGIVAFRIPVPVFIRAPDNWYEPYYDAASQIGLQDWYRFFGPAHHYNRGEMAALLAGFAGALDQHSGISPVWPW